MERDTEKVLVIPCSGIGKVHGLISREAAYLVTDELAPDETDVVCLALLVKEDEETVAKVQAQSVHHHRRLRQGLRAEERGDRRRRGGPGLPGGRGS